MCPNNWKPGNTIADILKENKKNILLIENIKKFLLIIKLNKIKLPTDLYPLLLNYM